MLTGVFANNFTLEIVQVKPSIATPVGYVFASAGPVLVAGSQEQRWVLYPGFSSQDGDEIQFRRPSSELRQYASLAAWKAAVGGADGLWVEGATYVKVDTTMPNGLNFAAGAGTTESRGPTRRVGPQAVEANPRARAQDRRPEALAVAARGPQRRRPGAAFPHDNLPDDIAAPPRWLFQFVDRVYLIQNDDVSGQAFGTEYVPSGVQEVNSESWVLLPQYQYPLSAEGEQVMTMRFNPSGGTMEDFLGEDWVPGSTLVSASCTYFTQLPESL